MDESTLREASRKAAKADAEALIVANDDLSQRARDEGLKLEYSADDDLLWVGIGPRRENVGMSLDDDLRTVLFFDPETHKINGVEVLFFMRRIKKAKDGIEFWRLIVDILETGESSVYIPPRTGHERLTDALGALTGLIHR